MSVLALVVLGAGAGSLGLGLFVSDLSAQLRLLAIGLGSLGSFIGVAMVSPRLVRPLAAFVGAPAQRLGGVGGALARQNAVRNPGRTAARAAASRIGLTLVTTVAVLGQGLRTSAKATVERQVVATTWSPRERLDGVPTGRARSPRAPPCRRRASAAGQGVRLHDDRHGRRGDKIADFYRFRFSSGSNAALAALDRGGAIVRRSYAEDHDLVLGSSFQIVSPAGKTLRLRVEAILDQGSSTFDPLLGSIVIRNSASTARSRGRSTSTRS